MNKQRILSAFVFLSALCLVSCDPFKQYVEQDPSISVTKTEVYLESEGTEPSILVVKANRSWNIIVPEDIDWLKVDRTEYLNLEKIETEVDVAFSAIYDNPDKTDRTATVKLTSENGELPITIKQGALVPRLEVEGAQALADAVADAGSYTLTVKTNVAWTASVAEGATAIISLDNTGGFGDGEINVTLGENKSATETKTAAISIVAEDVEPIVVSVLQRKSSPYMKFPDATDGVIYVEEGLPEGTISIATNSSWTASLEDIDGFDTPVLAAGSGTRNDTEISFALAQYAACFGRDASMKLKATLEDGSTAVLTIKQKPVLRAKFGTFRDNAFISATAEEWPLSSPSYNQMPTAKDTSSPFYCNEGDLVLKNGYIIKINSNAGIWIGSGTGLNGFGSHPTDKTICSYLVLPAIEGVKLTRVVYHAAASSTKKLSLSIRDAKREAVVAGGEVQQVGNDAVSRPVFEWNLSGTKVNTAYSIHQANTGNMYLGDLILYYE